MPKPQGATPKKSPSSVSLLAAMLIGALLTMGIFLFLYLWNPFDKSGVTEQHTAMIQPKVTASTPKTEYEFYDLLRQQQVSGVPEEALASQTASTPAPQPDVVVSADTAQATASTPQPTNQASDHPAHQVSTVDNPLLPEEPSLAPAPATTTGDSNADTSHLTGNRTYILQINSFDNTDDADRRRAEVLMAGVDAQIVKRRLSDDSMVYQVISRVMTSAQQAAEAQQRLQSSGIDSLIVEQRHSN